MNHWQLPLDGLDQARSLHRMLMDRKFSRLDEFSGSPHIAAIQNRLADMIAAAEPGKHWDHWRQAEHHPDRVQQIRRYLQRTAAWPACHPAPGASSSRTSSRQGAQRILTVDGW